MPREFIARGASSFEDEDIDSEVDASPTETCQQVASRMVKRVALACGNSGTEPPITSEDIVRYVPISPTFGYYILINCSVSEAEASTSIAARIDYTVKRFLWL